MILVALRQIITGDAGIAALVPAERVFHLSAAEATPAPYIIFARISGQRTTTFDESDGLADERWQIDAYAETGDDAHAIGQAILDGLHGYRGTVAGVTVYGVFCERMDDDFFQEPGLRRVSHDYRVVFKE